MTNAASRFASPVRMQSGMTIFTASPAATSALAAAAAPVSSLACATAPEKFSILSSAENGKKGSPAGPGRQA